jgi:hypothetical protein
MEKRMQKDCYWYIVDEKMAALCVECAHKLQTGFFWKGSKLGYGNYNLSCSVCNAPLHLIEENKCQK